MIAHQFCAQPPAELAQALAQFEAQFTYPLGPERFFRISHGDDYTRFFRAIGEAACFVAERHGSVLGTLGAMTLECFRRTQEQFFFAVTFFPRPMAALVGRIQDPRQRLDTLRNLVEEHGEFKEQFFHHTTFQQFLRTIGGQPAKLDSLAIWPALRAFNSVLTASCVMDELEVGVACMGIIEYAFAGVSAAIGKAVVGRGWVAADRLVHYKLHAEIDERHAEEFFAVIEPYWDDDRRRYFIEQGLDLGAYIFDRLYSDLYAFGQDEPGPAVSTA